MRNKEKTIYVIGGTNGVGKSALYRSGLIKEEIPYINADFVAKQIAGGKQPTNEQYEIAQKYCNSQIANLMAAGRSYAFENNMHEEFNYKSLKEAQQHDNYRIEFFYVGVEDLKITTTRIEERLKNGDHYVPPGQVAVRFENGMQLLEKYYEMPDKLTLIDNSGEPSICYQMEKGQKIYQSENLPGWDKTFAGYVDAQQKLSQQLRSNIDEMKQSLKITKKETAELKKSLTGTPAEDVKNEYKQKQEQKPEQKPKLIQKKRHRGDKGLNR